MSRLIDQQIRFTMENNIKHLQDFLIVLERLKNENSFYSQLGMYELEGAVEDYHQIKNLLNNREFYALDDKLNLLSQPVEIEDRDERKKELFNRVNSFFVLYEHYPTLREVMENVRPYWMERILDKKAVYKNIEQMFEETKKKYLKMSIEKIIEEF